MAVWDCPFCGAKASGETCVTCGASAAADPNTSLTEATVGRIDQLFLLNSANKAAAMGVSRKIGGIDEQFSATGGVAFIVAIVIGVSLVGGCIIAAFGDMRVTLVAGLLLLAFDVIMLLFARQAWRNGQVNEQLRQHGQLLPGRVMSAQRIASSRTKRSKVKVQYQFTTPQAKAIEGNQTQTGGWYIEKLPEAGTPLAVMYKDETCYKVL